ncbi:MAG: hypothetical protein ACREMA_19320, partial [Longimicrobiales bacterium]
MGFDIEITGDPVRLDPRAINAEDAAEVQQILAATGGMTVDYLRSRTPEMRRPAPGRTNPRPAHP